MYVTDLILGLSAKGDVVFRFVCWLAFKTMLMGMRERTLGMIFFGGKTQTKHRKQ